MKEELIKFYNHYRSVIAAYNMANATMYFDERTICPKNGIAYRNEKMAILAGECFEFQMNKDNLAKLHQLYDLLDDGEELKKELKLYFKNIEMEEKLPKEVFVNYQKVVADAQEAWHNAKESNDYFMFKDHLIAVIEAIKCNLSYVDLKTSAYDYMCDTFQNGTSVAMYDEFFAKIKAELLPLIQKIVKAGRVIDDHRLFDAYDVEKQAQFQDDLHKFLQVNHDEIYMSTTEHPFTDFFSAHEARFLTKYEPNNLTAAILSTVHEYGHALYSLQVNEDYEETSFKNGIGSAMHESQSRLLENHIGRSKAMWQVLYPKLQGYFPQLNDIDLDSFMEMMMVSRPSLVRTNADELTYPIHILIRYELEKEIFNGNVDYDKLEEMWNNKYQEYLGITPSKSSEGILQDMHWGAAYFGYFPTYALGSAYAAQFYHAMAKEIDVEEALSSGHFELISGWLKKNVHCYGASLTPDEILMKATNEPFNPDYYINYLKDKYTKLYF